MKKGKGIGKRLSLDALRRIPFVNESMEESTGSKTSVIVYSPKVTQNYIYSYPQNSPEIEALRKRIAELEKIVERNHGVTFTKKIVVLEPATRVEAKIKILNLIKKCKDLGYSDIAEKLGLRLPVVVTLCSELEEEGKIEGL